jgi:hypothetical protein
MSAQSRRWRTCLLTAIGLATASLLLVRSTGRTEFNVRYVVEPGDSLYVIGEGDPARAAVDLPPPLDYVRLRVPLAQPTPIRAVVRVVAVHGLVQRVASAGVLLPLRVDETLGENDAVSTGRGASVALALPGGSSMVLTSYSRLTIRQRTTAVGNITPWSGLQHIAIDAQLIMPRRPEGLRKTGSPHIVAFGRGLHCCDVVQTGFAQLEVGEGSVGLTLSESNRSGTTAAALMTFDVMPMTGATAYRVQVSPIAGVLDVSSGPASSKAVAVALPDGKYRVRAFVVREATARAPAYFMRLRHRIACARLRVCHSVRDSL